MSSERKHRVRHSSPRGARERRPILGVSEGFPLPFHGIATLSHDVPNSTLRTLVVKGLYELNGREEAYQASVAGRAGTFEGKRSFHIGVGYASVFDYLDKELYQQLIGSQQIDSESASQGVLDFLLVVSYYYSRGGKSIPLRFDHYRIRFLFVRDRVRLKLAHVKGIRRTPIDEVLKLLIDWINKAFREAGFEGVRVEEFRTV